MKRSFPSRTYRRNTPFTKTFTEVSFSGVLTLGTNQGGSGDGYVWQDSQGYVHLSDEEGTQPIYDTLNVSSSGTFTPATGHAYNSVVVPSGTAGTPTASKGAVSNHSIAVTPSVTNTTGYITGSTKTGTGVTVSASELVSGTKSITENGTGIDVTNYASVDVNVSGSSSPTAKITSTGSSTYCYVRYPSSTGTKYYTLGDEFDIESGNILYFYSSHSRGGGIIYLNGSVVAGDGYSAVSYSYTVKENESIEIELEVASSESHIYITTINSGGGGLEYEEGTYTTSEDVSSADISFSNTHTNVPFFVGLALNQIIDIGRHRRHQ